MKILKFFAADPGPGMEKIWIRDKHPGSATLYESNYGSPGSLSVSDSYRVARELSVTKIKKLFDTLYRLILLLSRIATNFGKK